jgi:enoyl-CoA hydratase
VKRVFENIKTEIENYVGIITIDRQEVRNALNQATIKELSLALDELNSIPKLRIIVIKGAGEKAFVAGADVKELHDRSMLEALEPGMQGIYTKIEQATKVTIAVINGHALGGRLELALACDIRIAASHAKIGLPELNIGIIPGAGGTQRLSRMIGKGRAMDMILTGKIIDGVEAERIGLVSQVSDGDKLAEVTEGVVKSILSKGTLAVQLAKMVINKGADVDLDTGLMLEKLAQTVAFASEEKQEGTSAFLEKRNPTFNKS